MAKAKKTQKENLEPIGELKMTPSEKLEQCEWVFQFDGDEPQIFAWTGEDMTDEEPTVTFTISNTKMLIYLLQVSKMANVLNYSRENFRMKEKN